MDNLSAIKDLLEMKKTSYRNYEDRSTLSEYYSTDKVINKLVDSVLLEESEFLLEDFFLKKYGKILLNYVGILKSFKGKAKSKVEKTGINVEGLRKEVNGIVKKYSKGIEKSVKKADKRSLRGYIKKINVEISEYLNEMIRRFGKESTIPAVLKYLALLVLEFVSIDILNIIFNSVIGTRAKFSANTSSPFFNQFLEKMHSAKTLAVVVTSIFLTPFIEEKIKSEEIKAGRGSKFILTVSIGELIRKSIFHPFRFVINLLFGIFKVISTVTTGFIHYYYNKEGKTGLGRLIATIVNGLSSIVIVLPSVAVSTTTIKKVVDKHTETKDLSSKVSETIPINALDTLPADTKNLFFPPEAILTKDELKKFTDEASKTSQSILDFASAAHDLYTSHESHKQIFDSTILHTGKKIHELFRDNSVSFDNLDSIREFYEKIYAYCDKIDNKLCSKIGSSKHVYDRFINLCKYFSDQPLDALNQKLLRGAITEMEKIRKSTGEMEKVRKSI